ncbi:MAG: hypothetical protein AB8G15_07780, partial [Saprospiraceae bacterium]
MKSSSTLFSIFSVWLSLLVIPLASNAQSCSYTLDLYDSWGDGWNGSTMTVTIGGTATTYPFTFGDGDPQGGYLSIELPVVPAGTAIELQYNANATIYATEQYYELLSPDGIVLFSAGSIDCFECTQNNNLDPPAEGVVYTSTVMCPSCPAPAGVVIDDILAFAGTVTWNSVSPTTSYIVEYGIAGFTPGMGTSTTVTDTTILITGLDHNTTFDVYLQSICSSTDSSAVAGPFDFTTLIACPDFSNVSTDLVGALSADISWTASDSVGVYMVEYGPTGFTPGTGTTENTSLSSITLTGLNEKTDYDYYVTLTCDNGFATTQFGPFSFQTIWLNDVGVVDILSPQSVCGLTATETVTVVLQNFGQSPQSLVPFRYSVNGVDAGVMAPVDGFFTGVFSRDSLVEIEFETTFDFSTPGQYEIIAWTELGTDSETVNDTFSITINSIPTIDQFPYANNFESGTEGWQVDQTNSIASTWEFGTPTGTEIPDAASGVNAWVTSLAGNYNNNELSYLLSPCFDFSSLDQNAVLSFSIIYDTELNYDGPWVEGSIDGGATWFKLGNIGDGTNWYNFNNTFHNLGEVWAGTSNGWITAIHSLGTLAGEPSCRLRFAFDSDGSASNEGVGIDDILIYQQINDDLSSANLSHSSTATCGDPMDQVIFDITNAGLVAQNGLIEVGYQVGTEAPVIEQTVLAALAPGASVPYTFNTPFNSEGLGNTFTVKAWASLSPEVNTQNDTSILVFSNGVVNELAFVEDFEDGIVPDMWDVVGEFNPIGNGHNNTSIVLFDNLFAGDPSLEATTPFIGTINAGDSLTFDYRYTDYFPGTVATLLGDGDSLAVQVSIDCGETYNTVLLIDQNNHTPLAEMTNVKVDLDQFAGEIIKIKFLATWGNGDYWIDIDNVNILGCPESLDINVSTSAESTPGAVDGVANVSVGNGLPPFTYDWGNGTSNMSPITGLAGGDYDITVTDSIGCQEIISLTINTCPESLNLDPTINKENPIGSGNGSIFLNPSAG